MFCIRCIINDKVCHLIMDGVSFQNIMASTIVKKLRLKTNTILSHIVLGGSMTIMGRSRSLKHAFLNFLLVENTLMRCNATSLIWESATFFEDTHSYVIVTLNMRV